MHICGKCIAYNQAGFSNCVCVCVLRLLHFTNMYSGRRRRENMSLSGENLESN